MIHLQTLPSMFRTVYSKYSTFPNKQQLTVTYNNCLFYLFAGINNIQIQDFKIKPTQWKRELNVYSSIKLNFPNELSHCFTKPHAGHADN